ncbi:MAG: hypothetical protein HY577_00645 [Candidatus Nealsonbacteria bacterium]|nr:hypothetical protein [Candidatus Nealsonbacteria bacterium]
MEKPITKKYLDNSLDKLARIVKKGFDGVDKGFEGNRKEHQRIFDRLDKIDARLSGIVYRQEFEELKARMKTIEEALAIR